MRAVFGTTRLLYALPYRYGRRFSKRLLKCGEYVTPSDHVLIQRYLDVEAALARAQATLGVISAEAADAISAVASVDRVDFALLSKRTQLVVYPILPLVEQLSEWAEHDLGQYCHWGATTQDIMDTADVLQIRDASALSPYAWRTARDTPADVTRSRNGGAG